MTRIKFAKIVVVLDTANMTALSSATSLLTSFAVFAAALDIWLVTVQSIKTPTLEFLLPVPIHLKTEVVSTRNMLA
jgi:hypothetical protein